MQFWNIGDFFTKQPGVNVQVRGIAIPLVHDILLDQFVNDVGAIRFQMPNGEGCGSECLFYEVTATLRGRLLPPSGCRASYEAVFQKDERPGRRNISVYFGSLAAHRGGTKGSGGHSGMFAA